MKESTHLQKFKFQIEPKQQFDTLKAEYRSLIEQFKKETGSLEEVRMKLALSRRALCKLLMVDPSAWTRWTKKDQDAPPHVYQALKWYMQLIEKNPDVHAPLKLEQKVELLQKDSALEIQKIRKELQEQLQNNPKGELQLVEVLSENFKKFSESIVQNNDPKKALELEILKYDNKKLTEKITTLENKIAQLSTGSEKLAMTIEKLLTKNSQTKMRTKKTKKKRVQKISKSKMKRKSKKKKGRGKKLPAKKRK